MKIKFHYTYYILSISFILCGYFCNLLIFTSIILIHELGHVFMAKVNDYDIKQITIYPYGGLVEIDSKINTQIYKELMVSIGGILIQLIYFVVVLFFNRIGYIREYIFNLFVMYNSSILFFNLLPIYPLDGSKILSLILYYFIPYKIVNKLVIIISFVMIVLLFISNYYKFNYAVMMIISVIIYNLVKYYGSINYYFNRFLLERYLYNITYKKNRIINDEVFMYRDKYHIFRKKGEYLTEKQYLKRKFNAKE